MGGERPREPLSRAAPFLLLSLVLLQGIAAGAEPKEQWTATFSGRLVDADLTPGGRAAAITADGLVTFTDDKGQALRQAGGGAPSVRITPDGLKVAIGRASNVAVIDNSGRSLWETPVGGRVVGLGMDRGAQLVAAGADDKNVYLFDGAGAPLGKAFVGEVPAGVAVAGDRVAVGLPSGKVLLLDRAGGVLWQADAGAPLNAVDISSASVVAATDSNSLVAFTPAGEKAWSASTGSQARSVAVSDDGSLILAAAQAGDARLYNAKGEFIWQVKSEGTLYTAVGLSPGGYFAAVGTREGTLKVVRTGATEAKPEGPAAATPTPSATPKPTPTPRTESELLDQPVATPSRAVIYAPGQPATSWSKAQQTISGSPGRILSAAISPDGAVNAMLSTVGLYFLDRSGNTVNTQNPFSAIISPTFLRLEFSRDGQRLGASACDAASGVQADALYSPGGASLWSNSTSTTSSCAVAGIWGSADGSSWASLSADGKVVTWRDGNRQPLIRDSLPVRSNLSSALDVGLSPNGKLIAAGYGNRTIELFNESGLLAKDDAGRRIGKDEQFLFGVDEMRFTPDGKLAVRGGPDVYFLDPGSIVPRAPEDVKDQNMKVLWSKRVESILSLAVAEDAFAAGTRNKEVVWTRGGTDIVNQKVSGVVDSVALSANGKFLAASSVQDFKAWLFSDDGRMLWEGSVLQATGVSVANDGTVLVFASSPTGAGAFLHYLPLTTLDVDSTPSGAKVTVDGNDAGTTPVRIQGLKPGNRSVTVSLAGYKECTGTVGLAGGAQRLCLFVAAAAGATAGGPALSGTSPPPATPTPSPTPAAPSATAKPPPAPASSATPAASPAPVPASASPPPKKSPGFDAPLAIAAALGAALVWRSRRHN